MIYNPFTLKDKTILFTGASCGIGKATAIECIRMGSSRCIIVARSRYGFEEYSSLMEKNCDALINVCYLPDFSAMENMVVSLPAPDGVVCNADINKMQLMQF